MNCALGDSLKQFCELLYWFVSANVRIVKQSFGDSKKFGEPLGSFGVLW